MLFVEEILLYKFRIYVAFKIWTELELFNLLGDEKKETKLDMSREAAQKRNAKAFGVNSAVAMRKKFNVSQDRKNNKEFIPLVKNQSDEPPPLIVALVGPPKVGKSTLIRSLIKVRSW